MHRFYNLHTNLHIHMWIFLHIHTHVHCLSLIMNKAFVQRRVKKSMAFVPFAVPFTFYVLCFVQRVDTVLFITVLRHFGVWILLGIFCYFFSYMQFAVGVCKVAIALWNSYGRFFLYFSCTNRRKLYWKKRVSYNFWMSHVLYEFIFKKFSIH